MDEEVVEWVRTMIVEDNRGCEGREELVDWCVSERTRMKGWKEGA